MYRSAEESCAPITFGRREKNNAYGVVPNGRRGRARDNCGIVEGCTRSGHGRVGPTNRNDSGGRYWRVSERRSRTGYDRVSTAMYVRMRRAVRVSLSVSLRTMETRVESDLVGRHCEAIASVSFDGAAIIGPTNDRIRTRVTRLRTTTVAVLLSVFAVWVCTTYAADVLRRPGRIRDKEKH